jgi:hypothetical protein
MSSLFPSRRVKQWEIISKKQHSFGLDDQHLTSVGTKEFKNQWHTVETMNFGQGQQCFGPFTATRLFLLGANMPSDKSHRPTE